MGERLESWKEIAAYLDREVRTAQRWALTRQLPVHRLPGGVRPRVFALKPEIDAWLQSGAGTAEAEATSVAVLPFLNLSGTPEGQYFGDGLAEDLINALVRIPALRVTARTSSFAFSGRGQDVRQIGEALGAAWLIEGSVRRDAQRVRVSVQLVSAHDGFHSWSECFDRQVTDAFAIQDDIARAVSQALRVKLAGQAPRLQPTDDAVANDLWMKGRSLAQLFTADFADAYAQALGCYEAAISRDPRFARPYFGLAELLFLGVQFGLAQSPDDIPRAREAITRSLELDDQFGESHALLGVLRGILDYDWPGADAAFQRAFELSPGSASVLTQHAWYHLVPRRRFAEAVEEAQEAVALDPMSAIARGFLGLVYLTARQHKAAVEECRRAVQLAPRLWLLHFFYGNALLVRGRLVQGFRESRAAYEQHHHPLSVGAMCLLYGQFRQRKKAGRLLAELEDLSRTAYVPPIAFAIAHLGLGDDRAFEWFDKAIDARDPIATHLPSMPFYDGIRKDPRFKALLDRMHLG